MAEFRLWATINQIAPRMFVVIVSATPTDGGEGAIVKTATTTTHELAVQASEALLIRAGQIVRERGDRVVDVVEA